MRVFYVAFYFYVYFYYLFLFFDVAFYFQIYFQFTRAPPASFRKHRPQCSASTARNFSRSLAHALQLLELLQHPTLKRLRVAATAYAGDDAV